MRNLTPKFIITLVGLWVGLVVIAGLGVVWKITTVDDHDYPFGSVVNGVGRCGSTEYFQRGRSIRIERYRCIKTDATPAEIVLWYIRNGYVPQNQGMTFEESKDRFVDVFEIERVYPIEQKDGTTMIRIYDDTVFRAPIFSNIWSR